MELVLAERTFSEPVDLAELGAAMKNNGSCLDLHDAESVRIANRKIGMPFERIWTATIHEPSR